MDLSACGVCLEGGRVVGWCVGQERVAHFRGLVQFAKIVEWSVGLGGDR